MEPDFIRKDARPAETIERLYSVLDAVGLPRERARVQRLSAGDSCHSCHLRFTNYPLLYANGKGISPDLALASALAEFVERLQCRIDELFARAGAIHRLGRIIPGERRAAADVAALAPSLATTDLAPWLSGTPAEMRCLPFVDVIARRQVYLPYEVLCRMTGSNGMCAGNTPAEAITHGICEVFERHVIRQLETGAVAGLPTIPADALPLRSDVVRRQVEELHAAGIEMVVKDASLGGCFPVVGAVLRDPSAGTCHVSFGSDPCFDAALSRCLTEAFQGTTRLFRRPPIDSRRRPVDIYNNLEVFAERLCANTGEACAATAFAEPQTNAEALGIVLRRVQRAGRGLYIRDFSLFGFPSYYVYIEELSALSRVEPGHFPHLDLDYHSVRRTLFRLPWASTQDVAACALTLFDQLQWTPGVEARLADDVLAAPVVKCVELRPLLAMMLLEGGEIHKARALLERPPLAPPELEAATSAAKVAELLPSYLQARNGKATPRQLQDAFNAAFGGDLETMTSVGREPVPPLLLPRCASVYHCGSCPCRKYCRLDEWYRLARRLRERAKAVDQETLLELLATL